MPSFLAGQLISHFTRTSSENALIYQAHNDKSTCVDPSSFFLFLSISGACLFVDVLVSSHLYRLKKCYCGFALFIPHEFILLHKIITIIIPHALESSVFKWLQVWLHFSSLDWLTCPHPSHSQIFQKTSPHMLLALPHDLDTDCNSNMNVHVSITKDLQI